MKRSGWCYRGIVLSAALLLAGVSSVTGTSPSPIPPAQQAEDAISPASPNFVPLANSVRSTEQAIDAIQRTRIHQAGFQFEWPTIGTDGSYKKFSDTSLGGFSGDEWDFNIFGDANIYDGLITGLSYGHTERWSDNGLGSSDRLHDDYGGLYIAKQFFNWWNVGATFNWTWEENRITGISPANLDNFTHGYTCYTGASYVKNQFSANTTVSFSYNIQEMDTTDNVFQTTAIVWSNNLGWRFHERWKATVNWAYSDLLQEDGFPGVPAGGTGFWTFGPRLNYKATDKLDITLGYAYTAGPANYTAHLVRLSLSYAF